MLPSVNFKSHLGRYELLAKMASGGMGEIFLARLEGAAGFEKLYVVKRILPHLADDLRFRGMLIDEARIASKLSHPNICQVYELGETDGELYIAMEYLEGVTLLPLLRHAVQNQRPLELGLVACVIQQICEALHYAHELRDRAGTPLNIVHRDVTPSNIFVTESGQAKVLDFGIAKARTISSNTQTGTIKGKHAYMAPEQLRGAALDRRVDVFAVGILLFEMLALRRLFQRRTDYLTLQAVMEEAIPDVRLFRGDLPPALVATLGRALQRERDLRFETVRQLGAAVVDAIASVERVWTPSELGDQLSERFGADLRRRNAGILSAISKPPVPPGATTAATAIPSIEELEVRGARPRARTRGATSSDGSTDVQELPVELSYDDEEAEDDDLPSLGSAVYAETAQPGTPSNPMANPMADTAVAQLPSLGGLGNPALEATAVLGPTSKPTSEPTTGSATGPMAAMRAHSAMGPVATARTTTGPLAAMQAQAAPSGQMAAMPAMPANAVMAPMAGPGSGAVHALGLAATQPIAAHPGQLMQGHASGPIAMPGALPGQATAQRASLDGGLGLGEPLLGGYYSAANPVLLPPAPPPRRSWPWVLFAVALLGIAGAALFFVWRGSQRQQTVLVVERGNARANGQPLVPEASDPSEPAQPSGAQEVGTGTGTGTGAVGSDPGGTREPAQPIPTGGEPRNDEPRDDRTRDDRSPGAAGGNELRKRLQRMRPEVARCWSEHADAQAVVTDASVAFKIETSGKVSSVQIVPDSLAATPVGACIRKVFLAKRFPEQKESTDIKLQLSSKARPPI